MTQAPHTSRRRDGRKLLLWTLAAAALPGLGTALALQTDDSEDAAIRYSAATPADAIARLQQQIDKGQVTLKYDPARGYLPSVLQQLRVPVSSQTLVYSKTSFQRDRISPQTPRALYFNDQVYVGWVKGGSVLELASVDPQLGAVFYTLNQEPGGKPKFARQTYECLSCHSSTLTRGVPGLVMRSVIPDRSGLPILQAGTYVTTHESPLKERWGGWYVSGTHGSQLHMGNLTASGPEDAEKLDLSDGANVTDLRRYFDATYYLSRHSDIVALMVAEHQTHVQNLITKANYGTRMALHSEQLLNRDLGRPANYRSESTVSRIKSVGEPLVRALLFTKEAALTHPVAGTTSFAREFAAQGPRDAQNRSLRDLDLKRRLFRYPCSYLIHSEAFDALPKEAKEYVYGRLRQVLRGEDRSPEFAHLSDADRKAILEILTATKKGFAAQADA
jgi:hypothetical protein